MNTEKQAAAEALAKNTDNVGTDIGTDHELARAEGEGMTNAPTTDAGEDLQKLADATEQNQVPNPIAATLAAGNTGPAEQGGDLASGVVAGTTLHTDQPPPVAASPFDQKDAAQQSTQDIGAEHTALIEKVVALADTCGIGLAHNAHDMVDHIHKYVHSVQAWMESAAAEVSRLRVQLAAGEGKAIEEAETQADGVYDDVVADVRKVFSGRRLVLTVARDHLEDLAIHALPAKYRGRWGSFPDVPRPQAAPFEVPAVGEVPAAPESSEVGHGG